MTQKEILTKAKELVLAHPTKGFYARDAEGNAVNPVHPNATCWCSLGAMFKVTNFADDYASIKARCVLDDAAKSVLLAHGFDPNEAASPAVQVNDYHEELIAEMFDVAIEKVG